MSRARLEQLMNTEFKTQDKSKKPIDTKLRKQWRASTAALRSVGREELTS